MTQRQEAFKRALNLIPYEAQAIIKALYKHVSRTEPDGFYNLLDTPTELLRDVSLPKLNITDNQLRAFVGRRLRFVMALVEHVHLAEEPHHLSVDSFIASRCTILNGVHWDAGDIADALENGASTFKLYCYESMIYICFDYFHKLYNSQIKRG
jgi:hypothetical protein